MILKQEQILTIPEQLYGLVEFYDAVATAMGLDSSKCEYDCRKIDVARNIQENFYTYYIAENPGCSKNEVELAVTMLLACSGPKMDSELLDNQVKVYDDFIREATV